MKKHLLLTLTMATAALFANANAVNTAEVALLKNKGKLSELYKPAKPTYHEDAVVPSWKDNWFVNVQGGAASFLGSPLGCEDLFGRLKPVVNISVGKWHTPSIGNRISFQGFKWKNAALETQDYQHYHADFLLNLTPMIGLGNGECRFDIIPFVGLGLIDNRTTKQSPFALNYGVQGRFKLTKSLHVTAELSNASTFSNADGIGNPRGFGDNLLSLSAGISWSFGKHVGWKKVVDAKPYMYRNGQLAAHAYALDSENQKLRKQNSYNALVIAELKKILNIEGLLDKYSSSIRDVADDETVSTGYPVNDYSGLNSLRKRLAEGNGKGKNKAKNDDSKSSGSANDDYDSIESIADLERMVDADFALALANESSLDASDYWSAVADGSICLGAPIYFFFELGTANLVDDSQTVNLDAIASLSSKYGLRVEITGAADSATGTEEINDNLGKIRSRYVADYLSAKGVDTGNLTVRSVGGTNEYSPKEANRNCVVRLYLSRE